MSNVDELLILLALFALAGLWMKLSTARERAAAEARAQCERHGLQLLDETVGLRAMRLRRVDGQRRLERCYAFEVSVDGADREAGLLWMLGNQLSELRLPTLVQLPSAADSGTQAASPAADAPAAAPADLSWERFAGSNVVPLRPRLKRPDGTDEPH